MLGPPAGDEISPKPYAMEAFFAYVILRQGLAENYVPFV
jgi:hypothetical protein